MNDLSFYSKEHGGTFHFIQFNILEADDFLKSIEFEYLINFLKEHYSDEITRELAAGSIKIIKHRKSFIDLNRESDLA